MCSCLCCGGIRFSDGPGLELRDRVPALISVLFHMFWAVSLALSCCYVCFRSHRDAAAIYAAGPLSPPF